MSNACERIRENLSRFLDNDLSGREATEMAAHLETCVACRHEFDTLRSMRQAMQGLAAVPPGADAARQRVVARMERAVREQTPETQPRRGFSWPTLRLAPTWRPALATLTAAAVVAGVTFVINNPPPAAETTAVPLPGNAEMSLLFDLHDAHVGGLSADEPVLRRSQAAEAHAALMDRADETVAGNL